MKYRVRRFRRLKTESETSAFKAHWIQIGAIKNMEMWKS